MSEDQLIKNYFFSPHQKNAEGVTLGIGDDCAILDVPLGYQLVTSVDTLLEDVHFPKNFNPKDLAARAVAVCVSDLAAMGAQARWMTLAISLPENNSQWLSSFSQSLHAACSHYAISLVGGDTVKGKLSISLTVMGIVETGKALRRDTAQKGDLLFVSGSLGASAFALSKILQGQDVSPEVLSFYKQPQARLQLGQELVGIANSCMDISDGVLIDAERLATASDLKLEIQMEKLPLHSSLSNMPIEQAINFATQGDDYELLFSVNVSKHEALKELSNQLDLDLSCIGSLGKKTEHHYTLNNQIYTTESKGYLHF